MKVFVSGACGYVGSLLCPFLLADGHQVVGYDIQFFGDGYWSHSNDSAKLIKGDIRDIDLLRGAMFGCDAVIHLACISNDHSCQLDEALSTSINYDAFEPMVIAAKQAGVKRFIYCSSSSVYGVSDAPKVTEDHPLVPLTMYNTFKAACEPLLFKHQGRDFTCVTIRPATVFGAAPRMRFDLTVNILTAHAVLNKKMIVFGGQQSRPNIHIRDMVDCYRMLLNAPAAKIAGQTFNVGQQNLKVAEAAIIVGEVVKRELGLDVAIETQSNTDNRSYHIDSSKIKRVLGFEAKNPVAWGVREMCIQFDCGRWKDALTNPLYSNVKQLVDKGFAIKDSLASYRTDRYAQKDQAAG